MSHRIAQHNRPRPAPYRRLVQPLHRIRVRPHRIFRHIHRRQTVRHRELHRLLRRPLQVLNRPVLYQSPYRARPQKRRRLNRNSRLLRNLHNRPYIRFHRSRRAIWPDLHPVRGNLSRQPLHRLRHPRSRTWQTKVHRINMQRFHEMQYFDFFFNARIGHRRRLQPIPQRLVVHHHARTRRYRHRPAGVPIVNPLAPPHAESLPHHAQLVVPPTVLFPAVSVLSAGCPRFDFLPGSWVSLPLPIPTRRGGCPRHGVCAWVLGFSFLFPLSFSLPQRSSAYSAPPRYPLLFLRLLHSYTFSLLYFFLSYLLFADNPLRLTKN